MLGRHRMFQAMAAEGGRLLNKRIDRRSPFALFAVSISALTASLAMASGNCSSARRKGIGSRRTVEAGASDKGNLAMNMKMAFRWVVLAAGAAATGGLGGAIGAGDLMSGPTDPRETRVARESAGASTVLQPPPGWKTLEPGLELGVFDAPIPSAVGDSKVRVLRIDPERFELKLMNASAAEGGAPLTAREWCRRNNLAAAINASMYRGDHRTSVDFMRTEEHTNNPAFRKNDRSVLAFDPVVPGVSKVRLIDLECDDYDELRQRYRTLIQSIRMVSCHRHNVWGRQSKRWSTAAIGVDGMGRVLFIHVRSPYPTHDLIDALMSLPIDLRRAMYVEGGPEAQLYVHAGGEEREFVGSYETGFSENDLNDSAWPVPNVVGVKRRDGRGE